MDDKNEAVCFNYICEKYPLCTRARGKGCCIETDGEYKTVAEDECNEENGYRRFAPLR